MKFDGMEDSLIFDVKEVKNKSRRGSILFKIPPPNSFAKVSNEMPHSEYKKQMIDERFQWNSLIRKQQQTNKSGLNNPIKLDDSVLTEEQKIFMRAAPDFAKFQAESKKFCQDAEHFLKVKSEFQMKTKSIAPLLKDRLSKSDTEIAVRSKLLQVLTPLNLY